MTEKRFTVHIVWFNYDKTEGEITLKDNGQPLLECDCVEDVQMVKGLLNELHEENQQLKKDIKQIHTYIDNAILTERTRMGKNCLKQLKEGLQ